jgi:hypothetical protein
MKLIMTVMVRDEADIIRAMLEHHRMQGIDRIIVTDNGSIDGTTEILHEYATEGFVDLRSDPVHRKQQSEVVTAMARDAYTRHGADWVINADADEFWVAHEPGRTVRDILERTPREFQTFLVPVIDMIGAPALDGAGLDRLVYRDMRTPEQLHAVGLRAHSTPDAMHIGTADVEVAQGNHAVSLPSLGTPALDVSLEVLHLPWRSWSQYERKVDAAGRAYGSPGARRPSSNHHGMRDFERLKAGLLEGYYLVRHPDAEQLAAGIDDGSYVRDDRLAPLAALGRPDVAYDETRRLREVARAVPFARLEGMLWAREADARELIGRADAAVARAETSESRAEAAEARAEALEQSLAEARLALATSIRENELLRARKVVRAADWLMSSRKRSGTERR